MSGVSGATVADTRLSTIGTLFSERVRELTLATAKSKKMYSAQLSGILHAYAPQSSRMYGERICRKA